MISDQIKLPGISDSQRESEKRFNATRRSVSPDITVFKPAMSHEVLAVIFEENPTVALAKQGLYEEENRDTVFHPDNKNWIGYTSPAIEKWSWVYEISSRVAQDAILLLW